MRTIAARKQGITLEKRVRREQFPASYTCDLRDTTFGGAIAFEKWEGREMMGIMGERKFNFRSR
jgi:hypothetical protein